jgi:hypothetical protein
MSPKSVPSAVDGAASPFSMFSPAPLTAISGVKLLTLILKTPSSSSVS